MYVKTKQNLTNGWVTAGILVCLPLLPIPLHLLLSPLPPTQFSQSRPLGPSEPCVLLGSAAGQPLSQKTLCTECAHMAARPVALSTHTHKHRQKQTHTLVHTSPKRTGRLMCCAFSEVCQILTFVCLSRKCTRTTIVCRILYTGLKSTLISWGRMLAVSTYDPNAVNLHVITSDKQKIN